MGERLADLAILFIKQVTYRDGQWWHDYAGCPRSNLEYNDYGLRRGCLLCLLLKAIADEQRKGD